MVESPHGIHLFLYASIFGKKLRTFAPPYSIVTLRIILEQINEFQEPPYLVFIDCEQAINRLNHENMWEALRRKDLHEKTIGLIEAQCRAFSCGELHNGVLSDPVRVVTGVRQGCILSPLVFLIVIDEILVGAIDREGNRGLLWQPITMEYLNDFELADDVAGFSGPYEADNQY